MSLFTLVRQFVLSYRARRTQTHGGDSNVSESETENEQAEWMAIRELAQRAAQYEHENYDGGDE